MFDIEKQVAYWRDSAVEDLQVAQDLIRSGSECATGCFFLHLALEKLLQGVLFAAKPVGPGTENAQLDPIGKSWQD